MSREIILKLSVICDGIAKDEEDELHSEFTKSRQRLGNRLTSLQRDVVSFTCIALAQLNYLLFKLSLMAR